MENKYLTLKEVKKYTTLSAKVINGGIRSGELKFVFVGNKHLFKKNWVDNWLSMKGGLR